MSDLYTFRTFLVVVVVAVFVAGIRNGALWPVKWWQKELDPVFFCGCLIVVAQVAALMIALVVLLSSELNGSLETYYSLHSFIARLLLLIVIEVPVMALGMLIGWWIERRKYNMIPADDRDLRRE